MPPQRKAKRHQLKLRRLRVKRHRLNLHRLKVKQPRPKLHQLRAKRHLLRLHQQKQRRLKVKRHLQRVLLRLRSKTHNLRSKLLLHQKARPWRAFCLCAVLEKAQKQPR